MVWYKNNPPPPHLNLAMLTAAVINAENDPLIVTELHDTLLRKAYKSHLQGSSKLSIFWDVASALNYIYHYQWGEIIHMRRELC